MSTTNYQFMKLNLRQSITLGLVMISVSLMPSANAEIDMTGLYTGAMFSSSTHETVPKTGSKTSKGYGHIKVKVGKSLNDMISAEGQLGATSNTGGSKGVVTYGGYARIDKDIGKYKYYGLLGVGGLYSYDDGSPSITESSFSYGVGLEIFGSKDLTLTIEYLTILDTEIDGGSDMTFDAVGLGFTYYFTEDTSYFNKNRNKVRSIRYQIYRLVIMKKSNLYTYVTAGFLVVSLNGCSDEEDTVASAASAAASSSNTTDLGPNVQEGRLIYDDFYITVSDPQPAILSNDPTAGLSFTTTTVGITINADDINNLFQTNTSIPVNFKTEWGSFDTDSCNIDSTGTCTVNWTSGTPAKTPSDCYVAFVAYAEGEEFFVDELDNDRFDRAETYTDVNTNGVFDAPPDTFVDRNGNGQYDVTEVFVDLEEPFLDVNLDGVYTAGVNPPEMIDIAAYSRDDNGVKTGVKNEKHDVADGIYNGSKCDDATLNPLCRAGDTSTIIWISAQLPIQQPFDYTGDFDNNPATADTTIKIRDCVSGATLNVDTDGDNVVDNTGPF